MSVAECIVPDTVPSHHQEQGGRGLEEYVSRINGTGLWASWQRNFKSPTMALLDLMDNAVDATLQTGFPGRIMVNEDAVEDQSVGDGLIIYNNCYKRIPTLEKVLEVFSSQKGGDKIGENGVGVKQACASLANTSFILTKNKKQLSIGLIAKDLQEEAGCFLPSYVMHLETSETQDDDQAKQNEQYELLEQQLTHLIESNPEELGFCVNTYGNGDVERGRMRLQRHLVRMIQGTKDDHIFMVVLHDLLHEEPAAQLESFRQILPKQYLHIPSSNFEVRVGKEKVLFQYWERRLAMLSGFEIKIDRNNPWNTAEDWHMPDKGYYIRLFMGFDSQRASGGIGGVSNNKASLLVYSRESGRLIKHVEDARGFLSLESGGTSFAQGLTILLDDRDGELPLTPTKQDLAFGQETNGSVHEGNIYAWIGAFAHVYYTYNLDTYGGGEKGRFREKVELLGTHMNKWAKSKITGTLKDGDFNTITNLSFKRQQVTQRIRCANKKKMMVHTKSADTLIDFSLVAKAVTSKGKATTAKSKRKPADDDEIEVEVVTSGISSSSKRRARMSATKRPAKKPKPPVVVLDVDDDNTGDFVVDVDLSASGFAVYTDPVAAERGTERRRPRIASKSVKAANKLLTNKLKIIENDLDAEEEKNLSLTIRVSRLENDKESLEQRITMLRKGEKAMRHKAEELEREKMLWETERKELIQKLEHKETVAQRGKEQPIALKRQIVTEALIATLGNN